MYSGVGAPPTVARPRKFPTIVWCGFIALLHYHFIGYVRYKTVSSSCIFHFYLEKISNMYINIIPIWIIY